MNFDVLYNLIKKTSRLLLRLLLLFPSVQCFAQEDESSFFQSPYSGKYHPEPYDVRKDMFEDAESGRFNIQSLADAQLIVKKDLTGLVIAVELGDIQEDRLDLVYKTLTSFHKLSYIRLLGRGTGNQNVKFDRLIANIQKLPNLKGIEFAYTNEIDMEAALKKLVPIKQLKVLSFTEYKSQLPSIITSLTQIDSVKLGTINIGAMDLGKVSWTRACLVGDDKSWNDESGETAKRQAISFNELAKVSRCGTLIFMLICDILRY